MESSISTLEIFSQRRTKARIMPAKYSDTSVAELEAIITLEDLLDKIHVKPFINSIDKIPNYDGYLELTDDNQVPIGKVDVQVKKLADNATDPKHQCNKDFIEYCEMSTIPVLLILVDTSNRIAYWVHISRELSRTLETREDAASVCVRIPVENRISKDDTDYFGKWVSIIEEYRKRIQDFPQIYERLKEIDGLLAKSNSILGAEKNEFETIHRFLDELNTLLDTDFHIIKKILYPGYWKIGIAYGEFSKTRLTYALYPIPIERNDLQIKQLPDDIGKALEKHLSFSGHFQNNPIHDQPERYARREILKDATRIIENRWLPIRSIPLANEVLIDFVDKCGKSLGLKQGDRCALKDIKAVILKFPPKRIIIVGRDRFPLSVMQDAVQWLESKGETEIRRLFLPRSFDGQASNRFRIWSVYSPKATLENTRILFREFPGTYRAMIQYSFPNLKEELDFYNGFDELIIVIEVKDRYVDDAPTIWKYYLKKDSGEKKISIFMKGKDELPITGWPPLDKEIVIGREKCIVISCSQSIYEAIYKDCPLLDLVYQTLEERLKVILSTD